MPPASCMKMTGAMISPVNPSRSNLCHPKRLKASEGNLSDLGPEQACLRAKCKTAEFRDRYRVCRQGEALDSIKALIGAASDGKVERLEKNDILRFSCISQRPLLSQPPLNPTQILIAFDLFHIPRLRAKKTHPYPVINKERCKISVFFSYSELRHMLQSYHSPTYTQRAIHNHVAQHSPRSTLTGQQRSRHDRRIQEFGRQGNRRLHE